MFRVLQVHNKEVLRKIDDASFEEYGKDRFPTPKDWIEYSAMLRDHPYDKVAQATPWILVEGNTSIEDVAKDFKHNLAQCETYRMDCEMRDSGVTHRGNVYGITVVFVEESKRKRGYATKLLELVMKEIEKSDNNLQGFLLYSIIGGRLYEKLGFNSVPSFEWFLPIEPDESAYSKSRVIQVCTYEIIILKRSLSQEEAQKEFLQIFKTVKRDDNEFFIVTSPEQLDWHYKLEGPFTNAKFPRGFQVGNSIALFRLEAFFNTLTSIYTHFESEREAKLILDEMKEIAASLKLSGTILVSLNKQRL